FMKSPLLIEELINGGIGSTVGYKFSEEKKSFEPVLSEITYTEIEIRQKRYLEKGITDFSCFWNMTLKNKLQNKGDLSKLNPVLKEIDEHSIAILNRFFNFPVPDEVSLL